MSDSVGKKTCRVRLLSVYYNTENCRNCDYSDYSCDCCNQLVLYPQTDWQDITEEDFVYLKKQIERETLKNCILLRDVCIEDHLEEFRAIYEKYKKASNKLSKKEESLRLQMKKKAADKSKRELEWAKKVVEGSKNV
jgi:hypothetical protein